MLNLSTRLLLRVLCCLAVSLLLPHLCSSLGRRSAGLWNAPFRRLDPPQQKLTECSDEEGGLSDADSETDNDEPLHAAMSAPSPLDTPTSEGRPIRDAIPTVRAALQSELLSFEYRLNDNLSNQEREALKTLLDDDTRVVLPADKGKVVVVMDMDYYQARVLQMIQADQRTYGEVDVRALRHVCLHADNSVSKQLLQKEQRAFHADVRCRAPVFATLYALPKLHKFKNIQALPRDEILAALKFRPITSACGYVTYRLQKRLVPILKLLEGLDPDSFAVANVQSFIDRVRGTHLSSDYVLASFDVESMFTNVPVDDCLERVHAKLLMFASRSKMSLAWTLRP